MRLQEQIDHQPLDGDRIVTDLVIARRLQAAELQPVQRRLAGDRRAILAARFELPGQHRHHRIVAQFVVIVEILIAERDPEHPLADQRHHLMLDQFLTSLVMKACREPLHHPDRTIRRAQQQRPGIRGDRPAVERRHHFAAFHGCKSKQIRATLCRHRGAPRNNEKSLQHNAFADSLPRCTKYGEISGLAALDKTVTKSIALMRSGTHLEPRRLWEVGLRLFERRGSKIS